jgi:hypothetical protein
MTIRKYSSRAQQTTLTSGITSGDGTMTVGSGSNLMGGKTPAVGETYTVVIDPDTALEEIVDVSNHTSGNTLTIARGRDGSTAVAHFAGAIVRHMVIGRDLQEANDHIENTTTAHGITLANLVKTTDTGTVTSTMITDGTIVNADINASAAIADTKLATISTASKVSNSATTATSANTNSAIVARDASGNFVANEITAAKVTGLSTPATGTEATNKTYVDGILGSATAASTSAAAAAASAVTAGNSATTSTTQAGISTASATTSTNAATTATTQATSATNSATGATSSASSATASAATATTQATSATNSATSATASATSATASAASATSSATAAAGSATNAGNSYTAIVDQTGKGLVRDMGSITDADTTTDTYVGINALVSTATTQAANASTSATAAGNSATSAGTSATAAAASATAAAASYDSFDDRYLGPKASAPSADNDGNALLTGALYFDTTTPGMYVWTGSAWTVMATSGDIESVTAGTGLSGGGTAGAVTVSLNTSSIYVVPSQTGSNGYFLTTNGSAASWANLSDWGTL